MKIGIVTHYYKSTNYGGNLQAYALCAYLNRLGHDAVQISYDKTPIKRAKVNWLRIAKKAKRTVKRLAGSLLHPQEMHGIAKRNDSILSFNEIIPHTPCYNVQTVGAIADEYDLLITGSDQVWHPLAVCDAYLLTFGGEETTKISYAASVATDTLSPETKQRYKRALASFAAVSVREESAVELLRDIAPCDVEVSLDPTLLLSKEDWEAVLEPTGIPEKYVFCYFLGDDRQQRQLAQQYAQQHGLKVVSLPYLLGAYRACDKRFGDYRPYDVSPGRFLSLIKHAEYVFTDSFHATVFSLLFEKQFSVFIRSGAESMSTRLYSLLELFDLHERFSGDTDTLSVADIDALPPIAYDRTFDKYERAKRRSVEYLNRWIGRTEENADG